MTGRRLSPIGLPGIASYSAKGGFRPSLGHRWPEHGFLVGGTIRRLLSAHS